MTFPAQDSLNTLGGALNDYSAVVDPTTDRGAAAVNTLVADVAMMGAIAPRAWCLFTAAATTAGMMLVSHNAGWGNSPGVAPTLARSAVGIYTLTWPASVSSVITPGAPGADVTPWTLNIQDAFAAAKSAAAPFYLAGAVGLVNVITVYTSLANVATDATGVNISVWWF